MPGDDIESRGREVKRNSNNNNNSSSGYASSSTYLIEDTETQWTSWLVPMFVVANIAVFIVVMYVNNCPEHRHTRFVGKCVARFLGRFSFEPLRENPLFGPSSFTLKRLGALEWSKVVLNRQGWRLVSCIWLHAGVIHLLANVLSLVFIGIRLEQQFGFVRIGILYLLSGFGGSVLSSLFIRNNISVGASGALFGLLGAMLSELITNWTIYTNKAMFYVAFNNVLVLMVLLMTLCLAYFPRNIPQAAALLTLLVIIVINLAIGILPHVDNFAHIGGFLTGFLLGFVLLPRPQFGWLERRNLPAGTRLKSKYKPYQYVLWLVSLVLLVVGFTVALIMLFRGENGNDHCRWCHYLSCVPTSRWDCNEN